MANKKGLCTAAVFVAVALIACGRVYEHEASDGGNSPLVAPTPLRDDRVVAAAYWRTLLANAADNTSSLSPGKTPNTELVWRAADLPLKGRTAVIPWSQSYWSFASGGVQRRIQTGEADYPILSKSAVLKLDAKGLSRLSPTEKYDVFMNFLEDDASSPNHFLMTKQMRYFVRGENAKGFSLGGFCHAWAALATAVKEPSARSISGLPHLGNVSLSFSSADIAALMSLNVHLNQSWAMEHGRYAEVGRRCAAKRTGGSSATKLTNGDDCASINAGVFHVIVTNQLGRLGLPVIVDTRPDYVILNEPLYGYTLEENESLSRLKFDGPPAPDTVTKKFFRMRAEYAVSPVDAVVGGGAKVKKVLTHVYRLELDAKSEVIGGSWASGGPGFSKPDFVWTLGLVPESESLPKLNLLTNRPR